MAKNDTETTIPAVSLPRISMFDSSLPNQVYKEQQARNIGGNKERKIFKLEASAYSPEFDKLVDIITSFGCVITSESSYLTSNLKNTSQNFVFKTPDTAIMLNFYTGDNAYTLEGASFNKTFLQEVFDAIIKISTTGPPCSNIMVLTSGKNGLELTSIGETKSILQRINYAPEVLLQYEHFQECLKTNDPCGRLVLLSGPPGTGKSYMIRALTNEIEALFILVPASIAGDITGPSILPIMLEYKEDNRPIVLIIEDADTYISKEARKNNSSGISDLLNLGDGLFGEMADIRIVATSNADKLDIDAAVLRPGRMCTHIEMNGLTSDQANACYKELAGKDFEGQFALTGTPLSDIYKMVRNEGWKPTPSEEFRGGDYL